MSLDFHEFLVSDEADVLEVSELSEFVKDRFYLMILNNNKEPTTIQSFKSWKESITDNDVFYLNIDQTLVYDNFYSDFGPLNLSMVYHYINVVREKFKVFKRVIHCAHKVDHRKRANAAFLIGAYMVIEDNWTPDQTYSILSQQYKYQYLPFRDASCLEETDYAVSVEECINALYKAKWYGFFDFSDFDVDEYEKYETVEFGDINWIVPGTILAFSTPHTRDYTDKTGYQIHSPAYYYPYFKKNNVKHVVRLNSKKTYDAKRTFVDVANIKHTDMVFTDGTPPSDAILKLFLELCEQYIDDISEVECTNNDISKSDVTAKNSITSSEDGSANCGGAVAIHCKAGLGRTGCLIASYIMKHWPFTAVEAIAWIRICRPGSVIGVQQQWLINQQEHLKTVGKQWRERSNHTVDKYKRFKNGVYSLRRYTSKVNAYEYVDPPPESYISNGNPLLSSSSDNNEIKSVESIKECIQSRLSSVLKKQLKTNNHVQSNVRTSSLRQKRSASKNEDLKLDSTLSTIKNSRKVKNDTNEMNVSSKIKKKISIPNTMTFTRSTSKTSVAGKKNGKSIILNKTDTKSSKISTPIETSTTTSSESKPSYALSTVSSSARASQRLL